MLKPLSAVTLVALLVPASLRAADIPVAGKKLIITDKLASSGRATATIVVSDPAVTKGAGTDPATIEAAVKIAFDGKAGVFSLPAGSGWTKNATVVAKYANKTAPAGGAVKAGTLKAGKTLKAVARSLGDVPIDISVAPAGAVHLAWTVVNGGQVFRHCTSFSDCTHAVVAKGTGWKLACKAGTGDTSCAAFACGDGVVDDGEACDDGNTTAGDGCSPVCQEEPAYAWVPGPWGACSATCGGGSQSRVVTCRDTTTNVAVADSFCASAGPKPPATQACNTQPCTTYTWVTGPWSACSVTCGTGTQTRQVFCQQDPGAILVPDSFCSASGPKPATAQPCTQPPC